VEKGLGESDEIPRVSAATASKVEVGARYAGPAVGIATALVDVYRAPTLEDKCVEGVAGVSGLAAGAAGGELGALAGSAGGPWGTGGGAAVGSVVIGWIGSELGEKLGDVLCR
jgi:phage tail tape-measure protein